MFEVPNHQFTIGVDQLKLSGLEHPSVVVAQYRNKDLSGESLIGRIPIDVEEARTSYQARS